VAPSYRSRLLVIARNYPNYVLLTLGLWTQRLVLASFQSTDATVLAPVPYAPPFLPDAFTQPSFVLAPRCRLSKVYGDVLGRAPQH